MNNSKIWLSSPHMGGEELKYIHQAFDENIVAPLGPNVTGFEQDLENYLEQGSHVAALSAGTAALHLALILLDVKAGDEVICQSMTFSASANPIVYQGATPVFVGEGTHIGINATVIQGIKIGKWATIGAGSVVIKDIPDYAVVVGNPGKIIKYNIENE